MNDFCNNCYFCSGGKYCSALKEPATNAKTGCSFKKSKEQVEQEVYSSCLRISKYANDLFGRKTLLDILEKYPEVKEKMVANGFNKEVQLALHIKS